MWLIIGGGLLVLLLIGGIAVAVVSGTGDDKANTKKGDNTENKNPDPQPEPKPQPKPEPNPQPGPGPGPVNQGEPFLGGSDVAAGDGGVVIPANSPLRELEKRDNFGTPGTWTTHTGDGFTADLPGTPETLSDILDVPLAGKTKTNVTVLAKDKEEGGVPGSGATPLD